MVTAGLVAWLGGFVFAAEGGGEGDEFAVSRTFIAGSERILYAAQVDEEQGKFKLRFARWVTSPSGPLQDEQGPHLTDLYRGWGPAVGVVEALAASGDRAYLVFSDRSVQEMTRREPQPGQARPFEVRQLPPLPREGQVAGFVAIGERDVAILLVPDEAPAAVRPRSRADRRVGGTTNEAAESHDGADAAPPSNGGNAENGAGPDADAEPEAHADADPDTDPAADAEAEAVEVPRLLRLVHNRWQPVDLPEEVSGDDLLALVGGELTGGRRRLTLVTRTADGEAIELHHLRTERPEDGWRSRRYPIAPSAWISGLVVEDMQFLVRAESASGPFDVYLARQEAASQGRIEAIEQAVNWWTAPTGDRLMLILADVEQNLALWSWGPNEAFPPAESREPIEMTEMPAPTIEPVVWLLVIAMAIALVLLLVTMGNAEANMPRLPVSLRPAGTARVWAALIDFAPALVASMIIYGQTPAEVLQYWPSLSGEWERMPPAATAIGLHALHTLIAEMLTGRSLGKWLMGCRVVDLRGEAPHVWQVGGRNFFKILEMAVPWLLILPLLPSLRIYQQRLGDLIARTLVVVDVPEQEQRAIEEQRKKEGDSEEQHEKAGGERDDS